MAHNSQFPPDFISCPKCMELLTRDDLEGFGKCPYCDHPFKFEGELEDFLLKPVVHHWVQQSRELQDGGFLE